MASKEVKEGDSSNVQTKDEMGRLLGLTPSALPLVVIIVFIVIGAPLKKKFHAGELMIIYSMVTAAILIVTSNLYIQAALTFNFPQAYEGNPSKLGFYRDLVASWVYPDNSVAFPGWLLGNAVLLRSCREDG